MCQFDHGLAAAIFLNSRHSADNSMLEKYHVMSMAEHALGVRVDRLPFLATWQKTVFPYLRRSMIPDSSPTIEGRIPLNARREMQACGITFQQVLRMRKLERDLFGVKPLGI